MTVCVAAICANGMVVGAADRMLTAGDVEFEPAEPKVRWLTTAIALMIAGDSALQAEIVAHVGADVSRRVEAEPKNWWRLEDVARLYSQHYGEARLRRAEASILSPLGLDRHSFIDKQREMAPEFLKEITTSLSEFRVPDVQAIVCGVDEAGAHIYLTNGANVQCLDFVSFAAIGIGSWHAESQLMFAKHNKQNALPDTVYLVFSAKRRAEAAPGVGAETDMFVIGPQLGARVLVADEVIAELGRTFKRTQQRASVAHSKASRHLDEFVKRRTSASAQAPAPKPPTQP